jgi:hypothetical protein
MNAEGLNFTRVLNHVLQCPTVVLKDQNKCNL